MKRFASVPASRDAWRGRWKALRPATRMAVVVVASAIALLLAVGLLFGGVISDWLWPTQRAQALRSQAEAALQAGRLSVADGSGARELYEAALAAQPDQVEAREGLARVAQAALVQAGEHAEAGRIAHARIAMRLAAELQAPKARIDAMEARLRALELDEGRLHGMLARARAAHAAGRLDQSEDAALPLYQRVVLLQPRNQQALEGREDALEDLLQPAHGALAAGNLELAADLIRRAEGFDPGYAALPALRAELGRALERRVAKVRGLLAAGDLAQAASACTMLRRIEPDAPVEDCAAVAHALLQEAQRAAGDFDFQRSTQLLAQARSLGADHAAAEAAMARIRQARRDAGRLAVAAPSARTKARVAELLELARRAQQRGNWLSPPGESTWDYLREARALAPGDVRVEEALAEMLPAARRCHAEGLRDNNLGRAEACLQAWRQLAPADPDAAAARSRVAERWVAIGSERLVAGDVAGARLALQRARSQDPAAVGIGPLADRIERLQPRAD